MAKIGILELKTLIEIKTQPKLNSAEPVRESGLPIPLVKHAQSLAEKGFLEKGEYKSETPTGNKVTYEITSQGENYLKTILAM